MRKPSRVDAFDVGFYSNAVLLDPTPRVTHALNTCMSEIGLRKYDPLLFERLGKMVARDDAVLQTWYSIGIWLHFDLRTFEACAASQWSGHSLKGSFALVGVHPDMARSLIAKIDMFRKDKAFIKKKQIREVIRWSGIQMDLNTSAAVAIVEDFRDLARDQDEKEEEAMANQERERLHRPVNVSIHGNKGTVVLGTVHGNINSTVAALQREPATQEIAKTLRLLTDAVHQNNELASEQKVKALETIESLGEQARLPTPERKPSSYESALGYLPTLLKSAESASRLWETYGPGLQDFFKTHL